MKIQLSVIAILHVAVSFIYAADIAPKTPAKKITSTNKLVKLAHQYTLTIYYTPQESSYSSGQHLPVTLVDGTTVDVDRDFRSRLYLEGCGKVNTASNGMNILVYQHDPQVYDYASQPEGTGGTPLVAKSSCAVDATVAPKILKKGKVLYIKNAEVTTEFGNNKFTIVDTGGMVNGFHLDLYWGIDDPNPDDSSRPAGTNFGNNPITDAEVCRIVN
jgi:3D (Asp-Asp-Asp) domain-containing protein